MLKRMYYLIGQDEETKVTVKVNNEKAARILRETANVELKRVCWLKYILFKEFGIGK